MKAATNPSAPRFQSCCGYISCIRYRGTRLSQQRHQRRRRGSGHAGPDFNASVELVVLSGFGLPSCPALSVPALVPQHAPSQRVLFFEPRPPAG